MLIHWIWLAHRPKVSDRLKTVLLQRFQDPEGVYFAEEEALARVEGMTPEAAASLGEKCLESARKILETCEDQGIGILTFPEKGYPKRLRNIIDPPLVLYYKGRLPDFEGQPVIGVVGTRHASAYGLNAARKLSYQIAACGGLVISGMARGIDAMAMEGALLAGKETAGVLGCGVDVVYPAANRKLFRQVEEYGCIFSEFPPGTPPTKWNFPRRNRIISGMSNGVLVVEAPEKSGALITANLALDQGRDVFAIPGNIDQEGFVGSNRLLRDGALMVATGWDVLSEYENFYPGKLTEHPGLPPVEAVLTPGSEKTMPKVAQKPECPGKKPVNKEKMDKKSIDKDASGSYSDVNDVLSGLSGDEKRVAQTLKGGERLVDDVIAETGLSAGKLLAVLTMLELKGVVRRLPGKRVTLKHGG